MESYIVHIYRREGGKKGVLIGTLEKAGSEGRKTFTKLDDLMKLLSKENRKPSAQKSEERSSLKGGY